MRNRLLAAASAAALLSLAPIAASAGPISGYPAASTPLGGSETVIGTQSGSTVQITTQSIANIVTAATSTWTGVQTFPAPGASKGSIVLTPGTISGTPPNGSLWTTNSGVFAQINGATVSLAVGNAVTQFGSVISGDCAEWTTTGVIADVGTPCGSGGGGGGGSPGGANGTLQYNNGGSFGGASGFVYTLSGTKVTGPDGTVWNASGLAMGNGDLNLGNNPIAFNSTPGPWVPPCEGASFFFGVSSTYCSHATTGGTDNVGMGTVVFDHLTTGFGNVAIGSEDNRFLTTGGDNTSIGFEAGHILTTGSDNVAIGFSLGSETTGSLNVAVGQGALNNQAGGSSNVGVGPSSGTSLSTGANNVCIGPGSCPTVSTGNKNISIGNTGPGYGIATGHGNVWLGGQGATLTDQNDSVTLADGDGNVLEQYLTANGFDLFKQPVEVPFLASSNPLNGAGFSLGSSTIVGTSATVACATSHVCDSISGEVTLTTGTGVSTNGQALTIAFISRTNKPNCVVTSFKAASGTDVADNWSETVSALTLSSNANLASSTAYTIRYICGGI